MCEPHLDHWGNLWSGSRAEGAGCRFYCPPLLLLYAATAHYSPVTLAKSFLCLGEARTSYKSYKTGWMLGREIMFAPLTQTLVVRGDSSQGDIKDREFHPLLAMVTAEQCRRLDELEVQQRLQNLVPIPSPPRLPHYGYTQSLAGWWAARIGQAF